MYSLVYGKEKELEEKLVVLFVNMKDFFLTKRGFDQGSYSQAFWKHEAKRTQVILAIVDYFTFNRTKEAKTIEAGIPNDFLRDIGRYLCKDILGITKKEESFNLVNSVFTHNMDREELLSRLGKPDSKNFKNFRDYLKNLKA